MNARGLALRGATVGVLAVAGLGIAAAPAASAPREDPCVYASRMSDMGAATMQSATTYELWSAAYTLWLVSEDFLERFCS
jgi:hypothetical protein